MANLSQADVKNEVIARLEGFIEMIKKHGLDAIDIPNLEKEDCLNKATDALASGNLFDCIIYDTIDQM